MAKDSRKFESFFLGGDQDGRAHYTNSLSFCNLISSKGLECVVTSAIGMRVVITCMLPTTRLTHWGRVTHICISTTIIIGSDNDLSPGQRQTIIRTNDGILLMWPLGINISENLIEINIYSFKKIHFKMSTKWRLFHPGLNELTYCMVSEFVKTR